MSEAKVKFLEVVYPENQANIIGFKLGNGQSITFDMNEMKPEMDQQARRHGYNQKIRDAAAGFSGSVKKGISPDYEGAFNEMMKVIESLRANQWNRKGSGGGVNYGQYLSAAVARLKSITLAQAEAALAKITDEKRAELVKQPKVHAAILEVIAEATKAKAADSVDPLADLEFSEEDDDSEE